MTLAAGGPATLRRSSASPWAGSPIPVAGLLAGEPSEPGVDLIGPEGTGERSTMAGVLATVEREHARADDPGGGEPGVVDRERPHITHDLDGEVESA